MRSRPPLRSGVVSRRRTALALVLASALCAGCGGGGSSGSDASASSAPPKPLRHILFVGDSFTHGRYLPVRRYDSGGSEGQSGSPLVVDENDGQTGERAEKLETGPFGGIPGIFARFASEAGLNYDVHIETISETSLTDNYKAARDVIDQAQWDDVVLQELSSRPLPYSITNDPTSDPANFCAAVQTIEQGVHSAAPSARIYLYETWPRADLARKDSESASSLDGVASYLQALQVQAATYHDVYYRAAALDGHIQAVAPAGEAWLRAWAQNLADPDPFAPRNGGPILWYGLNAANDPPITQPDYLHPSVYGAYLSALVLFGQITGVDPQSLGASDQAAASLGITPTLATALQAVSWRTLLTANPVRQTSTSDPCAKTT